MAQIEKLKNAAGRITGWRVGIREGGRDTPIKWTTKIESEPEALATMRRLEAEQAAKKPLRFGIALPIAELVERFKSYQITESIKAGDAPEYVERVRQYAEKTRRRLALHAVAREWTTVEDITPEAVQKWRAEVKRTRGTARCLMALLNYARDFCDQPVHPKVFPALRPARQNTKPPGRLLTDAEVAALEATAAKVSPDCAALVHFFATYAPRAISLAPLRCRHFDQARGTLTMRVKSGSEIEFPLLPKSIAYLASLVAERQPEDPLFLDPRNGKAFEELGSRSIPPWVSRYLKEGQYNVKRYAITTMLENGMDVRTIMLFTGHKTPSVVLGYARTSEAKARTALGRLPGAPKPEAQPPAAAAAVPAGVDINALAAALAKQMALDHAGSRKATARNGASKRSAKTPAKSHLRIVG